MRRYCLDLFKNNIFDFELYLNNYCNLKCKYCNRFCNITKNSMNYEKSQIIEDLKYITSICDCNVYLSGGEPLLYKDLENLLYEIRKFFKRQLVIQTNGKRFASFNESFYKALNETNTEIQFTKYVNSDIDYDKLVSICKSYNITHYALELDLYYDRNNIIRDHFMIHKFTRTKNKRFSKTFYDCSLYHPCMWKSKIYVCGPSAFAENINLNNYKCGLEISKVNSLDDIKNFCTVPNRFCMNCKNDTPEQISVKWETGKQDIQDFFED